MVRTIRRADAREQQTQIIMNLSHRAHSRARVVAGGFLFNRNGGRESLNQIDIGLFHQLQKLPRIR